MKYKGIELIAGKDSAAELLIHLWIPDDANDDLLGYTDCPLCVELENYLYCCGWDMDVTKETEHLITVRMNDGIPFDHDGVDLLVNGLYKEVSAFVKTNAKGLTVKIGVHVDAPGESSCFFDKDGNWYNEDSVMPDEFLANIVL